MKIVVGNRRPWLMRRVLSLLLIAAIAISGCGGKDTSAPAPSVAPTEAAKPTSALTAAKIAAPAPSSLSADTIPIPSGGSLVVSAGALPKGTKVDVAATQMPVLPDDVKPVGAAFAIGAAAQPAEPVALRLPIPAGVADPENLAIIRVETDGAITFLLTEVDGRELVAHTPGFSTFAIGELPPAQSLTSLQGNGLLYPGQRTVISAVDPDINLNLQGARWRVTGNFTLVYESATVAIVQAGNGDGTGLLSCEFLDLIHGRRWFASKELSIYSDATWFTVSLITHTPQVAAGDNVSFSALAGGKFVGPLTWRWNLGNGVTGEQRSWDAADRSLELPSTSYSPGSYFAKIAAQDANGLKASGEIFVHVSKPPFQVTLLEGPQILAWKEGGVTATYTAQTNFVEPVRNYVWRLPGGQPARANSMNTPTLKAMFSEPGSYRLELSAEDVDNNKAAAALPIRVQGGEVLSTRLLDLPVTAKPKTSIPVLTQIRGGVLVVSSKKTGYTLQVDWGDGGKPQLLENVGANKTPSQGTSAQASHTYAEPKTYTVRVWAYDATGNVASDERKITITDASPTATPTASQTKRTPAAKIPTATKAAEAGRWVRAGAPLINATDPKAPTEYYGGGRTPGYFPEERFTGKFTIYRLSETLIAMDDRDVDRGKEFWNITIESRFDAPPPVLTPGQVISLAVKFSGSAKVTEGAPPGARFQYGADKGHSRIIQPADTLSFNPAGPRGPDSKTWTLTVPQGRPGDTFQVWAGWWNCAMCNVTWTYRYEAD